MVPVHKEMTLVVPNLAFQGRRFSSALVWEKNLPDLDQNDHNLGQNFILKGKESNHSLNKCSKGNCGASGYWGTFTDRFHNPQESPTTPAKGTEAGGCPEATVSGDLYGYGFKCISLLSLHIKWEIMC